MACSRRGASEDIEHLTGVEGAVGIERLLDRAHEPEFNVRRVALELGELRLADAMLSAETASLVPDKIVDDSADLLASCDERT